MSVAAAILSGVTSSAAWDFLKTVWAHQSDRSWQQLYLQSFEKALNDYMAELTARRQFDADVQLDQTRLTEVFQYELGSLEDKRISAVTADTYMQSLAVALQAREVLVIGGLELVDVRGQSKYSLSRQRQGREDMT